MKKLGAASIRTFSPVEAAWLAGVIDGEGSIGLYDCADSRVAVVQLGNTNKKFICRGRWKQYSV